MKSFLAVFTTLSLLAVTLVGSNAWAQAVAEKVISDELETAALTEKEPKGWTGGLHVGASTSFTHNSKVVGAQEGVSFQLGVLLDGNYGYYGLKHEWDNTLNIKETFSKLPSIDSFLKTQDELSFASTYFYRPPSIPWLGPFARFRLQTAIFPGYDVRDADVDIQKSDKTSTEAVAAQEQVDLTGWFEPLELRESIGAFARPIEQDAINLRFQLGVGAQEVLTQGGYVLADDDATPALELARLEDYYQVGAELEAGAHGKAREYVSWSVMANLFQPFYSSVDRGKDKIDLLNIAIEAKVSVKLADWLSLDYVLTAKRVPLILDEWQVQNGLLLTAGFDVL